MKNRKIMKSLHGLSVCKFKGAHAAGVLWTGRIADIVWNARRTARGIERSIASDTVGKVLQGEL